MILERIEGSRRSRVLPAWQGLTAALIAGGPSLTLSDVEIVRQARLQGRLRVIVVNDAYLLAPWADVHYAADAKWHAWHTAGIAKPALGLTAGEVAERWRVFAGQKAAVEWGTEYPTPQPNAVIADESVHLLGNLHEPYHGEGLSMDPERIVTGRHSGFQALNLAVLAGANTIILLGYDGAPAADGRTHWHGGHPTPSAGIFEHIRRSFSAVERELEAAGVTVLNCSPGSAINSFPKVPLAAALATRAAA